MVRALAVRARVIYDTVDLHWVRFERGAKVASGSVEKTATARCYKALELANIAATDATIVITADERDKVLAELPGATIHVLTNIHDIAPDVPPFEQRRAVYHRRLPAPTQWPSRGLSGQRNSAPGQS